MFVFRYFSGLQAEQDIVDNLQMREQCIGLEYHGELALPRRQVRDVFAFEFDAPGIRGFQTGDHFQGGGFAATRRTEQGHEFAFVYVKA